MLCIYFCEAGEIYGWCHPGWGIGEAVSMLLVTAIEWTVDWTAVHIGDKFEYHVEFLRSVTIVNKFIFVMIFFAYREQSMLYIYRDRKDLIFFDKAVMQLEFETSRMKSLKKNKKLHEKGATLVWPDFMLLNHKSKERQLVKRINWQCEIIEQLFAGVLFSILVHWSENFEWQIWIVFPTLLIEIFECCCCRFSISRLELHGWPWEWLPCIKNILLPVAWIPQYFQKSASRGVDDFQFHLSSCFVYFFVSMLED